MKVKTKDGWKVISAEQAPLYLSGEILNAIANVRRLLLIISVDLQVIVALLLFILWALKK